MLTFALGFVAGILAWVLAVVVVVIRRANRAEPKGASHDGTDSARVLRTYMRYVTLATTIEQAHIIANHALKIEARSAG